MHNGSGTDAGNTGADDRDAGDMGERQTQSEVTAAGGEGEGQGVHELRASLEGIMLVADEPVSEVVIAQVLERPRAQVAGALRELAASYAAERRGFDLREVAGGWRFYTREEY